MKYNLKEKDEIFILNNYPKYGREYCLSELRIEKKSLLSFIARKKLKRVKECKINIDTNNKYFCYILGLIWSDGTICKKTNNVRISLVDKDMQNIKYIFNNAGNWSNYYCNNQKRNYKDQISMNISDKKFKEFLVENDFLQKSIKSPEKLISIIPEKNIKYFIRGLSDGDGCFYYNKKNYTRQFIISSTYDQDWSYMVNILNKLDCKFEIRQSINEDSKSSIIRICGKDIIKVGNYIYEDFFGLFRKYEKFLIIKNSYLENPYENRKIRSKRIIIDGIEFESMLSAAGFFKINRNTLRKRLKSNYYESNYNDAKMI